eukprot:Rhum_TRINITY_DN12197_c0_g1::Rhum_TRINITY_DN12197_c0_g1_i2::g.49990::m.49990
MERHEFACYDRAVAQRKRQTAENLAAAASESALLERQLAQLARLTAQVAADEVGGLPSREQFGGGGGAADESDISLAEKEIAALEEAEQQLAAQAASLDTELLAINRRAALAATPGD